MRYRSVIIIKIENKKEYELIKRKFQEFKYNSITKEIEIKYSKFNEKLIERIMPE